MSNYLDLFEGSKAVTFREYAIACARSRAMFYHLNPPLKDGVLRVDPPDAEVAERVVKRRAELAATKARTIREYEISHYPDHCKAVAKSNEEIARLEAQWHAKFDGILTEIAEWTPPSEKHESLKAFMVEQIRQEPGCPPHTPYTPYPSAEAMRKADIENDEWALEQAIATDRRAQQHYAENLRWLAEFLESLPE